MRQKLNDLLAISLAAIFAAATYILSSVYFQNTTSRVLVQGYFSHDTHIIVSAVSANGSVGELDRFLIEGSASRTLQYAGSRQMNLPSSGIQLELFSESSSDASESVDIFLTSIRVFKPYMDHFYFNGENIDEYFVRVGSNEVSARKFVLSDKNSRAVLRSKLPISDSNWGLIIGLPVLFFFGTWFLLKNSLWSKIPAFADMSLGHRISSSDEFNSINGIRGLAALLVLLSHTAPRFEAVQIGLSLLFVISGFLLSKPFVIDSQKIFSWTNIEHFVTKRLKRILPMYYFYIFLIYVVTFKFDTAIRHFFFVQAEGHLWPMTQIFLFYMLLPFVLLICCATYRIHRIIPALILTIAIYFSIAEMGKWTPFYNGERFRPFFLYAFLMGVLASYIQYDWIGPKGLARWGSRWQREILGCLGIVLVFYTIAWSAPLKPSPAIFKWVSLFWVKCAASALIILVTLNTHGTLYNKIISNSLFRSVGVIGFSFYILHGLGMQIFEQIQLQYLGSTIAGGRSWEFVIGAFFVSYLMAIITYSYVERPFFGYREKKS